MSTSTAHNTARPYAGLYAHGVKIMSVRAADQILLHLPGHFEVDLFLCDIVPPPRMLPSEDPGVLGIINAAAIAARDHAEHLIRSAPELTLFLPQPTRDLGWAQHLRSGHRQSGYLLLDSDRQISLNQRLIESGHCTLCRYPSGRFSFSSRAAA